MRLYLFQKSIFSSSRIIKTSRSIALLVVILLITQLNSFCREKVFNYFKNGVSFSIPVDWKTISDESLPDKGYYYSAESNTTNGTGLFSLVTINVEENPINTLLVQQKNMKAESIYQESGIEFTEIVNSRFGSMDARKVVYEAIVKGTKVAGTIYCFNCSEKTYLVFFQTGLKEQKKNFKVFGLIESTFACR
jgi:hypothetical protein